MSGSNLPIRVPIWLTSLLAVLGWGLILAWGISDPEGGTKALIKMFGTANQLLAVMALSLATVVLVKRARKYAWVTAVPAAVVASITLTASYQSIFAVDPRVGAIAAAHAAKTAVAVKNAWLTAGLTGVLAILVVAVLILSLREIAALLRPATATLRPAEGA
jgi:carbon starvation protein